MRAADSADGLKVAAIAGSYVTLLGMDMAQRDCDGLLGFAVHRTDHTTGRDGYMRQFKAFRSALNGAKRPYSTRHHPLQSFWWEDYTTQPGHDYTYKVSALTGPVSAPEFGAQVSVSLHTERPHDGAHDIYFNRGVSASQRYAEKFHNMPPDEVGQEAWTWLSRGLYEALSQYVRDSDASTALRIAAYELDYAPFLDDIATAVAQGADVQIVYERHNPEIFGKSEPALKAAGLTDIATPRTANPYISHNKFIVKMVNGSPQSVWTGGTNFSDSGIFGQSNVAQVVNDQQIATQYLQYWQALQKDPNTTDFPPQVEALSSVPEDEPDNGVLALFSPRGSLDALNWYAERAQAAHDALFMTFAFGMDRRFQDVYENSTAPIRLALFETLVNRGLRGNNKTNTTARMKRLRRMPQNTFAVGSLIKSNALDGWLLEKLSGLAKHVNYVHNKFVVIDPLSDDPIVINGSANFSEASTRRNDENMLVVRGDLRVADVFFTEFIRLHRHHAWRESQQWRNRALFQARRVVAAVRRPQDIPAIVQGGTDQWLAEPGDAKWPWWHDYFDDFANSARRSYYANPHVPPAR